MPLPVAFVVMPFRTKPTGASGDDTPSEVDFDALFDKVYRPVLEDLGYKPVRADQDAGALIISQMLQRLTMAKLIVADVTLPNANVYYEIGVRHAAKERGCVLTSATWAKPVFDLDQMSQLRYPLADGRIGAATAKAASKVLKEGIAAVRYGKSPVYDAVPGYPDADAADLSAFEDFVAELSAFQARTRSVRAAPRADRKGMAVALVAEYGQSSSVIDAVALELLYLLRDYVGWDEVVAYTATLPVEVLRHPIVREQQYFAMAQSGDPTGVGLLEGLADEEETSERLGLVGGRYKKLWATATDDRERSRYLDKAIEQYELGMKADLNAYYPSSNLPRLYRCRGDEGDEHRAEVAAVTALAACQRAFDRGADDGWLKATLLGAAFDAGDVVEATKLARQVQKSDPADWQLQSTIADLRLSVQQQVDPQTTDQLQAVLDTLEALI